MTPYLTRQAAAAISDGRTTQAWMMAALTRAKKMPRLESLVKKRKGPMKSGIKEAIQFAIAAAKEKKGK